MPAPQVHAHGDEGDEAAAFPLRDRPINLVDIARVLGESGHVERLGQGAPIRAWRDVLTLIRDSLSYATAILAADVAILTRSSSTDTTERRDLVDDLPSTLSSSPNDDRWEALDLEDSDLGLDVDLFVRTDHLLAPHREMARVDLTSPAAAAGVLAVVEEQLALLTERQAAVEARLQQIRAVIIRQYREGAAPAHDQPA